MVSLANFQNTITYGQFYNAGGIVNPTAATYTPINYKALPVDGLVQNCGRSSTEIGGGFRIDVTQDGAYFMDFSFTAEDGDDRQYTIKPFINDVQQDIETKFFQQVVEQQYEVSVNYIFNLEKGDRIEWKIYVATLSDTELLLTDIKLMVFSLQQLGLK